MGKNKKNKKSKKNTSQKAPSLDDTTTQPSEASTVTPPSPASTTEQLLTTEVVAEAHAEASAPGESCRLFVFNEEMRSKQKSLMSELICRFVTG
jgi:hypothetical protein